MKTVRRPPYPKWNPGYFPCSSLTPLPLSSRRPSVSFGGFGLRGVFKTVNVRFPFAPPDDLAYTELRELVESMELATARV